MLSRTLVAFAGGMVLAGGIAWFVGSKPEAPAQVAAAPAAQAEPVVPAPAAPAPVAAAPVVAPAPVPQVSKAKPKPVVTAAVRKPEVTPAEPVAAKATDEQKAPPLIPMLPTAEPPNYTLPLPAQNLPVAAPTVAKPVMKEPEAPRKPRTVTLPAGTLITVRLDETLDSGRNEQDYTFRATLDSPLVVDNLVLAERGSTQLGRVMSVQKASRARNTAELQIALTKLTTSDGQTVDIDTEIFTKQGERGVEKRQVATRAGVGAMIGAAIGAMAGGGKGAAIGAGAGAGAGAGSVMIQKGEEAVLTSETRISFRLKNPVTITEKLNK